MAQIGPNQVAFDMYKAIGKQQAIIEGRIDVTRSNRTRVIVSGKYQRNRQLINLLVAVILGITTLTAFAQGSIIIVVFALAVLIAAAFIIDRRTRAQREIMYALRKAIYRS